MYETQQLSNKKAKIFAEKIEKVKKIIEIMKTQQLTQKELKELLGGFAFDVESLQATESTNLNTKQGCSCSYYDGNKAQNSNKVSSCSCECSYN